MRSTVILLLAFGSPALAADYWPLPEGAVYTYRNAEGDLLEVTYGEFGSRISHRQTPTYGYRITELFSEDADGDVVLTYLEGYEDGAIDPEYFRDLGNEFVLLDLPLTLGKSWASVVDTACCYGPCQITHLAQVGGPAQVTVPAGEFEVVQVYFQYYASCTVDLYWGTLALERDLGPVVLPGGFELVSIDGVVGVDGNSWSRLKATYR